MDRAPGERQGAKPASGLCGLLPVLPRPGVRDTGLTIHAGSRPLL